MKTKPKSPAAPPANKSREQGEERRSPPKPKRPNTAGAPDDKDPSAQYEDKSES